MSWLSVILRGIWRGILAAGAFLPCAALADAVWTSMPCPFASPPDSRVVCGAVTVEENRQKHAGVVSLAILRIAPDDGWSTLKRMFGDAPAPAVVLGGGGPGAAVGLDTAEAAAFWNRFRMETLAAGAELILTDQRGVGRSRPSLHCGLFTATLVRELRLARTMAEMGEQFERQMETCLRQLTPIDLSAYTTADSAADAEDIRRALNIEQWDLIGFSYASRIALEVARRYPGGVRALLLDSPYPFDAGKTPPFDPLSAALDRIGESCREDSYCRQYGDLRHNLNLAAARLTTATPLLNARHPRGGAATVALTPPVLAAVLAANLYDERRVARLPKWAAQLAKGDYDGRETDDFLRDFLFFVLNDSFAHLLFYRIECAENAPRPPSNSANFPAAVINENKRMFARICDRFFSGKNLAPPADTDKPALLLAGAFDHATPPQWARALAARLPNARLVVFPSAHTPLLVVPCARQTAREFLRAPNAALPATCDKRRLAFH